jgi:uncharacterized protein
MKTDVYDIAYEGLVEGVTLFQYEINSSFFDDFEDSLIRESELSIEIQINKHSTHFEVTFKIKGSVTLECDKCMNETVRNIYATNEVIVKETDGEEDDTDDIIFISRSHSIFNVRHLIYEFCNLNLPMVVGCEEPKKATCNMEMIEKIELLKIKETEVDPRWDALKNYKD